MVVLSGQAVIAIAGSYGTLSEIAYAIIHGIPVIGLDTWDYDSKGHDAEKITRATPVAAAKAAIEQAKKRQQPNGESYAEQ
jgi:predicted Rossmann-fold nucleotide-binding protein